MHAVEQIFNPRGSGMIDKFQALGQKIRYNQINQTIHILEIQVQQYGSKGYARMYEPIPILVGKKLVIKQPNQKQKSYQQDWMEKDITLRQRFFQKINNMFEGIDNKIGPSKMEYKPGCDEDKQMFLECVLNSPCYQKTKSFKYCAQDGVDKECKAIRYDYYLCKRSMIFWNKAFSQDDPRKV